MKDLRPLFLGGLVRSSFLLLFPVKKEGSGVFIVHGAKFSVAARDAVTILVPVYFSAPPAAFVVH